MIRDRSSAGQALADALAKYRGDRRGLILALPRGGVILGSVLSRRLELPLDIFISQKIRRPQDPELALGAVTETGTILPCPDTACLTSPKEWAEALRAAKKEADWRRLAYRADRPLPVIKEKTIILTDDGVATGATFLAAISALRALRPARLVAAVAVGPRDTLDKIKRRVDELAALEAPEILVSVGSHYNEFEPVSDAEVLQCLAAQGSREHAAS